MRQQPKSIPFFERGQSNGATSEESSVFGEVTSSGRIASTEESEGGEKPLPVGLELFDGSVELGADMRSDLVDCWDVVVTGTVKLAHD